MNFDWQTEDDNWGAPPPSTPEPPPADRSHWRWVGLAAFILLLLTTSGWYLFRQANNRIFIEFTAYPLGGQLNRRERVFDFMGKTLGNFLPRGDFFCLYHFGA